MKIKVYSLVGIIFFLLLLIFSFLYYIEFALNFDMYNDQAGFFQRALNLDHEVYILNINYVRQGDSFLELANDKGIAHIYIFLSSVFPFLVDESYILLSYCFNVLILSVLYFFYCKVCDLLSIPVSGRIAFFLNLSLIYFAQLINKDMLTILAFVLAVYLGMTKRLYILFLLMPFFLLVRIQLVAFFLIYIFLMIGKSSVKFKILLVYTVTSFIAGYLTVKFPITSDQSLAGGFNLFLVEFNRVYYYSGYFFLNPLRVIQYFYDAYLSFDLMTEHAGIDTAKLLRLPLLVLFLFFFRSFISIIMRFEFYIKTQARPLILVVVSYFLTWLVNPTVNARYVMLIMPVLVIFALYVAYGNKKSRVGSI